MAKVILQNVRCSYVFVEKPRKNKDDDGEGKYSIQVIVSKDDPQVKKVKAAIKAAAVDKFGKDVKMGAMKLPLRDGDEERDEGEYNNTLFFNANASRKPGIVNRKNEPADQADIEEYCFSGAIFHVSVDFYAFNFQGRKGVAVGLNNIMLRKKGERMDGTASASDEFKDMADADDDFEDDDDF